MLQKLIRIVEDAGEMIRCAHHIEEDITEQIRKRPAGGVITIVIDADELPDNIVGEEPKPGGGFDASVENWENEIEEEIII